MPQATPLELASAARFFHALSDETRLAVLDFLRNSACCVCDLTDELDVSQPLLSFHLKVLKEVGLVSDRREGRWVYYTLNPEPFAAAQELLGALKPRRDRREGGASTECC